jgi:hypothetical protein
MKTSRYALAIVALLIVSSPVVAQDTSTEAAGDDGRKMSREERRQAFENMSAEEREQMRKRFESMSPEQRQQMRQRAESMTPEERQQMRQRAESMTPEERQQMRERRKSGGERGQRGRGDKQQEI